MTPLLDWSLDDGMAIPIEEHIAFCVAAMREHADELGLRGNHAASAS